MENINKIYIRGNLYYLIKSNLDFKVLIEYLKTKSEVKFFEGVFNIKAPAWVSVNIIDNNFDYSENGRIIEFKKLADIIAGIEKKEGALTELKALLKELENEII